MAENPSEIVYLRNSFYRDNYRKIVLAVLFLLCINVALLGIIFYQMASKPVPRYFATSDDGRIIPLYALTVPMVAPTELLQWATRTAVSAYTYNFVDYREALQRVQNRFTADGWKHFENALKSSRNLEAVISKKLVVSAVATAAPVILEQGVINGRYAWKVQMPLLITYQGSGEQTQQPVVVTMVISRVPTYNMPTGIAVASFVSSTGKVVVTT